jgi:CRISPR/Cas system CSM-associated protein Csm4 (group 5 of RAMP superfamily)
MQQFILEEQLEVICDENGREFEEIVELEKEEFIQVILRLHEANSSRKWRSMVKNAKMDKSDLSLNTYMQYVEDFKFWVLAAGNAHRLSEKEIVKIFVSGQRYFAKKSIPGHSKYWWTLWLKQDTNWTITEILLRSL